MKKILAFIFLAMIVASVSAVALPPRLTKFVERQSPVEQTLKIIPDLPEEFPEQDPVTVLQAGKDSHITNWLAEYNFGNNPILSSGHTTWGEFMAFVDFDLPDLTSTDIESAELCLYRANRGRDSSVDVGVVTQAWQENTITFNNKPSFAAPFTNVPEGDRGWNCIDVTQVVLVWKFQQMFETEDYGFYLDAHGARIPYYSSETAYPPELRIS